jgi:hypothetical protein
MKTPWKEGGTMETKRWCLLSSMLLLAGLMIIPAAVAAESLQAFRQQNGLLPYEPPAWFLEGQFIAREKDPVYVFGPVRDFIKALGGTATWLIEDQEMKRLDKAAADGKTPEYTLFLEAVWPDRAEYLVFVVLPHESAKAWYDARRAYHGSKAKDYYGETQEEIERALGQGLKVKAELRFLIENGDVSLQVPEDVIRERYKYQPVFDLRAGHSLAGPPRPSR